MKTDRIFNRFTKLTEAEHKKTIDILRKYKEKKFHPEEDDYDESSIQIAMQEYAEACHQQEMEDLSKLSSQELSEKINEANKAIEDKGGEKDYFLIYKTKNLNGVYYEIYLGDQDWYKNELFKDRYSSLKEAKIDIYKFLTDQTIGREVVFETGSEGIEIDKI